MDHVSSEKLVQDLRVVVADAEDLLKATASQTGERIEKARARAEESLRAAKARLLQASDAMEASAREAAERIDGAVRENPWSAVGVAAGLGLIIGILIGRR
jgi:ElaB/YqjD/DUF883 family membrane-anchored ribosome-binding protein